MNNFTYYSLDEKEQTRGTTRRLLAHKSKERWALARRRVQTLRGARRGLTTHECVTCSLQFEDSRGEERRKDLRVRAESTWHTDTTHNRGEEARINESSPSRRRVDVERQSGEMRFSNETASSLNVCAEVRCTALYSYVQCTLLLSASHSQSRGARTSSSAQNDVDGDARRRAPTVNMREEGRV